MFRQLTPWAIILFALWAYPVISLIILWQTKNKPAVRKGVFYVTFILTGISLLGLLTNISTTLSVIDWILVTSIYLSVSLVLWWTQFQTKKLLKISGVIIMVFIFGIGYISGSIGALGIGFVVATEEPVSEKWLGDGLIYKQFSQGIAFDEKRGVRVEIYKTIPWMPIIEWQAQKKEYENRLIRDNKINVDYNPTDKRLYLSATLFLSDDKNSESWSDTLTLE